LLNAPPREKRGAEPAAGSPVRLPRCRNGDDRPSGAARPNEGGLPKLDRLNTEPPSRDRPMVELLKRDMA
jgi:hypothetical protein